jgi:prepilin signal peptidase PulO-like enzyme (type II secretory pathway)
VTYPAIILALIVGLAAPDADASEVLVGMGICFGALFIPVALGGSSLGDVKLGVFMGAALGMPFSFQALVVMALAGGVGAAAILIASRFRARRVWIPYGPYIAIGFVCVMLVEGTAFRTL